MRFIALDKLINLEDGYRREFRIDFHRLLLLQHKGEHYLIEALCPHQEHPLLAATIDAAEISCPLHGYRFSLQSGAIVSETNALCRPLRVWPVAYEGSDVGVDWSESQ